MSCDLGPLAAAGVATVNITVTTPVTLVGNITDTAVASPGTNTSASESTTVVSPKLATSITDSPDPVQAGDSVTYAVTVTNNGSAVADATVVDTLPASTALKLPLPAGCSGTGPVTCDLGPLAAGGVATVNITVTTPLALVGSVTDSAVASPGTNATASVTTTVQSPQLHTDLAASPDPAVTAGNDVLYTLTVTNAGLSPVADAHVIDTLPPGTSLKQVISSPNGCTGTAPVDCDLGALGLGAGNAETVKLLVTSPATVPDSGSITDSATASPGASNNQATVVTTVEAPTPGTSKGFVLPGDSLCVTDTSGNQGTVTLPDTGDGAPVVITQGDGTFCNGPCTGPVTTVNPIPGYNSPANPIVLTQVYQFTPEEFGGGTNGVVASLNAAGYAAYGSTVFKLLDQEPGATGQPVPKCVNSPRTAGDYPPPLFACDAGRTIGLVAGHEADNGYSTVTFTVEFLSSDGSVGHR